MPFALFLNVIRSKYFSKVFSFTAYGCFISIFDFDDDDDDDDASMFYRKIFHR
mgnify:CR=1 FL=1